MLNIRNGLMLAILTLPLLISGCGSSGDAEVRLLNVSPGYSALDVYFGAGNGSSAPSAPQIDDVATGTLGSYVGISPANYNVYFTGHGISYSNSLVTSNETFSQNEHRTYVAYGDSGSFGEAEIDEDQNAPSSGDAYIQILNADPDAGALDIYLTSAGVSLNDVTPNFTNLVAGKPSGYSSITDGTYELRITGTGKKSDLRFDLPNLTLSNGEIVTFIVTETAGGYLVNVLALPQQGSLTTYPNPDARVRAVIGLSSGTSVTATAGSTTLVSAAPATAVGTYQLVTAGSASVGLTVDGTTESVPSKTLTAGQDYTFLVYGSPSSLRENWLEDSNIPAASGYSNVRLINVMSGSTDPISLSIDFEPVATDVTLGSASSYDTSVVSTSDATVVVTDYNTSATLYSQTSTTLNDGGVYTMFMFGSTSAPIGELYEDR